MVNIEDPVPGANNGGRAGDGRLDGARDRPYLVDVHGESVRHASTILPCQIFGLKNLCQRPGRERRGYCGGARRRHREDGDRHGRDGDAEAPGPRGSDGAGDSDGPTI